MNLAQQTATTMLGQDLSGLRFGRLVVERRVPSITKNSRWRCVCDCGRHSDVSRCNLLRGHTVSCGCYREAVNRKHGMSDSPEFCCWKSMKQRCHRETHREYPLYGGRGISVCPRWRTCFEAFLLDMGRRPSSAHSIDRIDNDGDYEPSNCRWATSSVQTRNKRTNHIIEWRGEALTLTDWASRLGMYPKTLSTRIERGWSVERAFTFPVQRKRSTIAIQVAS